MDTVTYPDDKVATAVSASFVPLKINMLDRHPDFKTISGASRVIWAPTMIFTDPRRREVRRYVGWLPPAGFLAELDFVQGMAAFNRGDFDESRERFTTIANGDDSLEIFPEALYWQGIAGFLAGKRDMEALKHSWERLSRDYPGSRWATHASVIEDA